MGCTPPVHTHCSLRQFDVRASRCYLDSDKEKLLGIIEVGFSTLEEFNAAIREMLRSAAGQQKERELDWRRRRGNFSRPSGVDRLSRRSRGENGSTLRPTRSGSSGDSGGVVAGELSAASKEEIIGSIVGEVKGEAAGLRQRLEHVEAKLDTLLGLLQSHIHGTGGGTGGGGGTPGAKEGGGTSEQERLGFAAGMSVLPGIVGVVGGGDTVDGAGTHKHEE